MESSSSAGTSVRETADREREGAGAGGRAALDGFITPDVEEAGERVPRASAGAGAGGVGLAVEAGARGVDLVPVWGVERS